jgi:hypothetical protein
MDQAKMQKEQYDFAQTINANITPTINKSSGDYKAVSHFIATMEHLWSKPFVSLEESFILNQIKSLSKNGDFEIALNLLNDYIIEETKKNLTDIIARYPNHLREGIPTTMTIFGGFTNAISIHLALAKIVFEKLQSIDKTHRLTETLLGLRSTVSQFAKLQANTLKLIENLNGVISNQEEAYKFTSENFELIENEEGKLVLLPTKKFINQVITEANDPSTMIKSYNYEDDYFTAFVENKNFRENYSKPKGCPIHSSQTQSGENVMDRYFNKVEGILISLVS